MLEEAENSVTLLCLTASSGVPLYCRSRGGSTKQQLPFSVIGSLNGVHMFGSNLDVQLIAARTENTHVMWKVFHSSITLIVLSSEDDASDFSLGKLLDNVFNAMVLVLGLEELTHVRNIERLKKDLKSCYKLIDSFLDPGNSCADLTQCVECAVMPSRAILQVPHRFLTFQLVPDMEVVLLCGPNPSLQCLTDELVNQFWQPLLDLLKATARGSARCLQPGIVLSPGILGLLLINQDQRKSLFTVHPHGASTEGSEMSMKIRLCALRSFYALVTSLYFPCEKQEEYTVPLQEDFHAGFPHCPQHCYMVYTTHKAYVIHGRQHQLFLILKSDVPTFALRSLATCTLQALTAEDSAF
ncbi:protein fuzzy homolog isoform X3 [Pantherophis guttatus]|uniref:Protein fuzzy homolog isoform X3 n=1 Tax=Pantherophis guttatus TaxID=94885 RepID=A0A6P9BTL6_PANGU|nr:protein fuzzy homolog isoform X3 [Pantherophis guttatus]